MKRIDISLQSDFGDAKKDMGALQKMEDAFKSFVLQELKNDPEVEIEAIFNFADKSRMSGQWLSELDDYSRRTRCRQAGIETHEENPNLSEADFQRYREFRRQFLTKIEMGDNENQRRMLLTKRQNSGEPDDGSPLVFIDPKVLKADYSL